MWLYSSKIFTMLSGDLRDFHYLLSREQLQDLFVDDVITTVCLLLSLSRGWFILKVYNIIGTMVIVFYGVFSHNMVSWRLYSIFSQGAGPEAAFQLRSKESRPISIFPRQEAEDRWPVWLNKTLSLNAPTHSLLLTPSPCLYLLKNSCPPPLHSTSLTYRLCAKSQALWKQSYKEFSLQCINT